MDLPLVYIIVLNYKSSDDTINCVEAIKKVNYQNYRLLVIDNNSQDGSYEKLSQHLSLYEFHSLKKNIGYAGGNNYGMSIALQNGAEYVLILNPDVVISPDSLSDYIDVMQNNKNIGALNPIQLSSENGPVDQRFWSRVLNGLNECEVVALMGKDQLIEPDRLFGASILLSRSAMLKVGGFDPLYFAYFEEEDLCRRIKYFNLKLCVTFKSPVIHKRSYQYRPPDKYREYLRLKGRYLYLLKDFNRTMISNLKFFYYNIRFDFFSIKNRDTTTLFLSNYIRMLAWIFINYPKIVISREIERSGFSHLQTVSIMKSFD